MNFDVNFDIGLIVMVDVWCDGCVCVQYCGVDWDVEFVDGECDDVYVYQVSVVCGNCFVVVVKFVG